MHPGFDICPILQHSNAEIERLAQIARVALQFSSNYAITDTYPIYKSLWLQNGPFDFEKENQCAR